MDNKLKKILKIINDSGGCMCGLWESCDNCNPYSEINILKCKIKEIINGKKKINYATSITITRKELGL